MDGAGPLRFFWDMIIPLSRTNIAALFTIMFVWAWNEYLWPLLVTTDPLKRVAVVGLLDVVPGTRQRAGLERRHGRHADRHAAAAHHRGVHAALFVRGLVATEK